MSWRLDGFFKSWIPVASRISHFSRALGCSNWSFHTRSRTTGQWAAGLALVCLSLLAVESEAAVTFSNPIRTLSSSNNRGASQAVAAIGDAPFNRSVRVDWEENWVTPVVTTGRYAATAIQESTISSSGITAKGSVYGGGSFYFWGSQSLRQSSSSYFAVDFAIDSPVTVYLSGVLDLAVDTGGTNYDLPEVWLILSGQSGQIYSQHINAFGGFSDPHHRQINEAFNSLGVGQYNLTVYAETNGSYYESGFGGYGSASYDITLVPEPSAILLAGLGGLWVLKRRVRPAR